jgi:hypothetical protein
MSRMHAPLWALVVAALLVPVALHAQAGSDSGSTAAAQKAGGAAPAVETGHIGAAAKDTGQTGAKQDLKSKKAKRHHENADTVESRPYSPY